MALKITRGIDGIGLPTTANMYLKIVHFSGNHQTVTAKKACRI